MRLQRSMHQTADNWSGFRGVSFSGSDTKPFQVALSAGERRTYLGCFASAEEAALVVARFRGKEGDAAPPNKRPAASSAGPSAALSKRGEQPADGEVYVVEAEEVSHDDLGAGAAASAPSKRRKHLGPAPMTAAEARATAAAEGLTLVRAKNTTGFNNVSPNYVGGQPYRANVKFGGRGQHLGVFATAEEAALTVSRFYKEKGITAMPAMSRARSNGSSSGPKRPAASAATASAPSKRRTQPVDEEVYVVNAEAVSDDDDDDDPPAAPVLCYCERPAALLDGRWVCAQLVEGDFCILGREDE